ncbi:SRPBCC domain-containing protein [Niabella ginsengisoli]|uniref:SRPBCC domain-containing protein n=1 Tax=Niabella ginsengisoli TaxID=522298 RepID=A0ABS9SQ11_9BACT|nr:SRPBCC domain-containing protein [Niabella ginsengisoli]MCH5600447.1 SRPBCC domain-containing protein [Niabella ginsengisoli]
METKSTVLKVTTIVNAPINKVWKLWTTPSDIQNWNSPSPDWHTPTATHDLKNGGSFSYRMEAKDGSFGFDYAGTFDEVTEAKYLEYTLGDGRKVKIHFIEVDGGTQIDEHFEAENQNTLELQQQGWQAILDNFKNYAEAA